MALVPILLSFAYLTAALFVLVRSSELFLAGAKHIGNSFGLSKFTIGVLIVAFGTSLPELASSIFAVLQGSPEVVIASVVGSNVTNILLIVGLLALISGRIVINQELIKTELPIFFIATALFVVMLYDGVVDSIEGGLLVTTFAVFAWYLLSEARKAKQIHVENVRAKKHPHIQIDYKSIIYIVVGIIGVLIGAHYTVEMTVSMATALFVPVGLISIAALSIGASLPELFVSLHALKDGEVELAVGNIFGSNVFNILVVAGIPALIAPLTVEPIIMIVGLPILIAASAIFFVTGLSKQVLRWEGIMMLLFFVFFVIKLATYVTV